MMFLLKINFTLLKKIKAMKTKYFSIAVLMVISTLHSCKKEKPKENEQQTAIQKDSPVVNPMAHVMDYENNLAKDSLAAETPKLHDKDAITLNSLAEGSTEKAYLVFNEDQSKAEIFLPNQKIGTILNRKGTEGNYTWTDGNYELISWKGYVLRTLKDAKPLFGGDSM